MLGVNGRLARIARPLRVGPIQDLRKQSVVAKH